jgi:alkylation response protein AidB-like acyl-CoA dehydrogenase
LPLCSSQRKCIHPLKIYHYNTVIAKTPRKNHKSPYCKLIRNSKSPPSIQLVFSNFYIGIALGALATAVSYTTANTRAWPYGGDNKSAAVDEFPILTRYGSWTAHLRAAEALADRAGREIAAVYERHGPARDVSARARGEAAEWVASVKIFATDTALQVTAGIFEVTGARATGKKVGLDRFWRDVRTHTLHDPVAYKERELGRFRLLDEVRSLFSLSLLID